MWSHCGSRAVVQRQSQLKEAGGILPDFSRFLSQEQASVTALNGDLSAQGQENWREVSSHDNL